MLDPRQIPHLITLLDDDSPEIRRFVAEKLISFGPTLNEELKKIPQVSYNDRQESTLKDILDGQKRIWLKHLWHSWFNQKSENQKLESALTLIAEFLSQGPDPVRIKDTLDELAAQYLAKFSTRDPKLLAYFLFRELGFKGDENDYYNPQNSNLAHVVKARKGIPISLASLYILVGTRIGLKVTGCNFPGHFLARVRINAEDFFVDCFNSGQLIRREDILQIKQESFKNMDDILDEETDANAMVRRFLANLIRAFQLKGDLAASRLMIELFKGTEERLMLRSMFDISPEDIIGDFQPKFQLGQIICHKQYAYRGIIVDIDEQCNAQDSWYFANQSQPDRNQPWYHVLVDNSDQVTYVAQSNIQGDDSDNKITHPLLSYFFTQTSDGTYVRNDKDWPGDSEQ